MPEPQFLAIPLDARPVCYDQVIDLANIAGLSVALPPKELLGNLKQPAPIESLQEWWQDLLRRHPDASIIASLDTLAYGGLISSRVNEEAQEILEARIRSFLGELKPSHRPRYAFASILRIPNYDNDEEEPAYWANYGRTLYRFSVETHQKGSMPDYMFNQIPGTLLRDFLSRRQKNFNLNKTFVRMVQEKTLDFLLLCQDDTGPFGLNVKEAEALKTLIQSSGLQSKAFVQTGADEAALILLAKALWSLEQSPVKIFPWFFPEHGKRVMARFDGTLIGNIVQRQIETLGGVTVASPQNADLILMINAPSSQMGDHCIQAAPSREKAHLQKLVEALRVWLPQKNVAIADVVYANGGDPLLIESCLRAELPLDRLAGYAGWNTPGNSIGSALAMGAVVAWGQRNNRVSDNARQRLLLTRLLDDWYYQAEVRIRLRRRFEGLPPETELCQEMAQGAEQVKAVLNLPDVNLRYSFPCQRLFEIAVHPE